MSQLGIKEGTKCPRLVKQPLSFGGQSGPRELLTQPPRCNSRLLYLSICFLTFDLCMLEGVFINMCLTSESYSIMAFLNNFLNAI